jgi:hypothetical protein
MTARLVQPTGGAPGSASLYITGLSVTDPAAIELAIVDSAGCYLDPRNPKAPWATSVYRWHPLNPRHEGQAIILDLDYGVTYHLRANRPYKLALSEAGQDIEERFTGIALRYPTAPPSGWTPPADPKGPIQVPVHAPAADPSVAASETPAIEAELPRGLEPKAPLQPQPKPANEALSAGNETSSAQKQPSPAPAPPVPPPKKWRFAILAAVALLLLLAGGAYWWLRPEPTLPPSADDTKGDVGLTTEAARKFLIADPAVQPTKDLAKRFGENKSLEGAFLLLRHAAEKGDAESALALGKMYDPATYSKDTSPLPAANPAQAADWYKRAAEAGNAEAQYYYGMLLKSGRTEEPNGPELAVQWLQKAAEQGHAQAKAELN